MTWHFLRHSAAQWLSRPPQLFGVERPWRGEALNFCERACESPDASTSHSVLFFLTPQPTKESLWDTEYVEDIKTVSFISFSLVVIEAWGWTTPRRPQALQKPLGKKPKHINFAVAGWIKKSGFNNVFRKITAATLLAAPPILFTQSQKVNTHTHTERHSAACPAPSVRLLCSYLCSRCVLASLVGATHVKLHGILHCGGSCTTHTHRYFQRIIILKWQYRIRNVLIRYCHLISV